MAGPSMDLKMSGFCNTSLWDSSLSWESDTPNVTPCFRNTVLIWVPCAVAWFLALFEISTLSKLKKSTVPWTWLYFMKMVLLALTFVTCSTKLVVSSLSYLRHVTDLAEVVGSLILLGTIILVGLLTSRGNERGIPSSTVAPAFWFLLFGAGTIALHSDLIQVDQERGLGTLCNVSLVTLALIQIVTSSFSVTPSSSAKLDAETKYHCTLKEWTLFPRLVFAYMWRIILLGFRRKLDLTSLNGLCTDLKCSTVSAKLLRSPRRKRWLRSYVDEGEQYDIGKSAHQSERRRSLYLTVLKVCGWDIARTLITEVLSNTLYLLPSIMLG